MKKTELSNYINNTFISKGYNKKSNNWIFRNDEITKIINIQKSKFNDSYYLNYGFTLNKIPLNNLNAHIFKRLNNTDDLIQIEENLPALLDVINSENDFFIYLKRLPNLNEIPVVVKNYFKLNG